MNPLTGSHTFRESTRRSPEESQRIQGPDVALSAVEAAARIVAAYALPGRGRRENAGLRGMAQTIVLTPMLDCGPEAGPGGCSHPQCRCRKPQSKR
jgi:hypothetical protein